MKNVLQNIGIFTVGVVVGLLISVFVDLRQKGKANDDQADTTTVIRYDTLRIKEPQPTIVMPITVMRVTEVPHYSTIIDTVKVPYYVHDTLIIPIEQRYYTGESYKAWVSGYKPKLDSILVYNTTRTVTIENTLKNTPRNQLYLSAKLNYIHPFPAMSIGVQAGFNRDRWGLSIGTGGIVTPDGLKWYGQVGLEYDLLTKQW